MFASKANRQYSISEAEISQYQDEGYDILDEDGKTILKQGKGKTVPYAKYQEALDQAAALQKQIDDLDNQSGTAGKKKE